jgi:predicted dehydrogenase
MTHALTRRRFLEQSVAAGAATLAAGLYVGADDAAKRRTVTVGIMGLSRGASLMQTFAAQPGVVVKYLCDVDETRAAAGAARLKADKGQDPDVIGDFRRILDDPEVDALVCAAPNHWHAPATILGCNAGKHVYVEKPCSHNPWEGELMVAAARKANKAVQMGTQRRSSSAFQKAISLLHDGVIGKVYLARSWYNNLRPSIGRRQPTAVPANFNYDLWQGPAPRLPYHEYVLEGQNSFHYNWHWLWHWGNGELGNNGVHALDICRWGLNVEYPTRVASSGGRYCFDDDQETPDTHTVAFEFEGGKQATWEGLSCNKHKIETGFVAFYGTEGSLTIDGSGAFVIYDRNDKSVQEEKGRMDDGDHVGNFIAAIRDDKPLNLNAEILKGHQSTLLCHLGNIAHRMGRSLHCDPQNGHILDDAAAKGLWKREYEPGWEPSLG